jgi:hypothetical protein
MNRKLLCSAAMLATVAATFLVAHPVEAKPKWAQGLTGNVSSWGGNGWQGSGAGAPGWSIGQGHGYGRGNGMAFGHQNGHGRGHHHGGCNGGNGGGWMGNGGNGGGWMGNGGNGACNGGNGGGWMGNGGNGGGWMGNGGNGGGWMGNGGNGGGWGGRHHNWGGNGTAIGNGGSQNRFAQKQSYLQGLLNSGNLSPQQQTEIQDRLNRLTNHQTAFGNNAGGGGMFNNIRNQMGF